MVYAREPFYNDFLIFERIADCFFSEEEFPY